jgi:RimJ/RimL family protein N-acetyltransferase
MDDPILIDLPEVIASERTLVRRYRAGDGAELFAAVEESREHILPWLPWGDTHRTVEDSEMLVRKWSARWELREDLPFGIFDAETGRYVGGTGLHRIDWKVRSFEIGYWIRKSEEGKGHITQSTRLLTELAFKTLNANRVFIRCVSENLRSAAVAKRVGFVYEGTLRNSIKDANDELCDALVYSLMPEEWEALRVV